MVYLHYVCSNVLIQQFYWKFTINWLKRIRKENLEKYV